MGIDYETLHQLIHATSHDLDTTLTVALDAKELLLVVAGLTLIYHLQPCLAEEVDLLGIRMEELLAHQWKREDEDDN